MIEKEKFEFCNNEILQDKPIETKPVGYFQDAMRRFAKNKSSVAAAVIILFLCAVCADTRKLCVYKEPDRYNVFAV